MAPDSSSDSNADGRPGMSWDRGLGVCPAQQRDGTQPDVLGAAENRKVGGSTPPLATPPASVFAGQLYLFPAPLHAATARGCPLVAMIGRPLVHAEIVRAERPSRMARESCPARRCGTVRSR